MAPWGSAHLLAMKLTKVLLCHSFIVRRTGLHRHISKLVQWAVEGLSNTRLRQCIKLTTVYPKLIYLRVVNSAKVWAKTMVSGFRVTEWLLFALCCVQLYKLSPIDSFSSFVALNCSFHPAFLFSFTKMLFSHALISAHTNLMRKVVLATSGSLGAITPGV